MMDFPHKLSDYYYELPPDLIAQEPVLPRHSSRLMTLNRAAHLITHRQFSEFPELLNPDDVLVINDTRVVPARFFAKRLSGGRIEGLFLELSQTPDIFTALLKPAARLKVGEKIILLARDDSPAAEAEIISGGEEGAKSLRLLSGAENFLELLEKIGEPPLPPYITRERGEAARDAERYQTIYAERSGAVAAPTAGLHFSPDVFERIEKKGVRILRVTLHVGLGTFLPVRVENITTHRIHKEYFEVTAEVTAELRRAVERGQRLVCVGTTSARVLETIADQLSSRESFCGYSEIFIYPPYKFKLVNALLTNFHLPESTLLMLVSAFAGHDFMREAYAEAVREKYRFYSYGDAMFIE